MTSTRCAVSANTDQIDEACRILQNTPYARKVDPPPDLDGWEPFMLRILKALRTADKSNWHHRMTARVGGVINV